MSDVSITINKRAYKVHCDDGQEEHLRRLAGRVNGYVEELVSAMGQVGDQRLLVMASLLLADELEELKGAPAATARDAADESSAQPAALEMDALADRIEAVADALDRATEDGGTG